MSSANIDEAIRLEYDQYRELYAEDQKAKQAKNNSIWGAVISASVGASGMIPVMTIGFAAAAYYYWTTQDGADERRKRMWTIEQHFERQGYANPAWGQLRRIEE